MVAIILEFYYHRISVVKQCKPLRGSQSKKKKKKGGGGGGFEFSRVSSGDQPLVKESLRTLGSKLKAIPNLTCTFHRYTRLISLIFRESEG